MLKVIIHLWISKSPWTPNQDLGFLYRLCLYKLCFILNVQDTMEIAKATDKKAKTTKSTPYFPNVKSETRIFEIILKRFA